MGAAWASRPGVGGGGNLSCARLPPVVDGTGLLISPLYRASPPLFVFRPPREKFSGIGTRLVIAEHWRKNLRPCRSLLLPFLLACVAPSPIGKLPVRAAAVLRDRFLFLRRVHVYWDAAGVVFRMDVLAVVV